MVGMMRGWGGSEQGWRKGPWTPEEDKLLSDYISFHGEGRWTSVARFAGLNRSGKSCRLRWVNYLRPGLKRGHITPQEEGIIIELHALWGNKWSTIARYLPGRTDNEIKNYWRTHFKKKSRKDEKQDRRKIRRKKNQQQQQQQNNGTIMPNPTPQEENNINQQQQETTHTNDNNNSLIAAATPNLEDNKEMCSLKTASYEGIESWVDSFAMDYGLWGGLWNLEEDDDNAPAAAIEQQGNDGSCKVQNQATTVVYPYYCDDHAVNLWNGGYIF